jgi:hypothetical protein
VEVVQTIWLVSKDHLKVLIVGGNLTLALGRIVYMGKGVFLHPNNHFLAHRTGRNGTCNTIPFDHFTSP